MHLASHYKTTLNQSVQCLLCPHKCTLIPGQYGKCNTRVNRDGRLISENYGVLSSISTDPVEKKPLYHFYPGRSVLSIGSFGCNLACDFCQNCEISQINPHILSHRPSRDPEDMVNKALLHRDNIGLAYTYNEPTIYFEYMLKCAVLIKEHQRSNIMVTNGYINEDPLREILPYMDAFNVDLKSFRNRFYSERSGATVQPVLNAIDRIAKSGSHLELTFLIIPGYNDTEDEWKELIQWITDHCGSDTILHVSRYFPKFKLNAPPTPLKTIEHFLEMARPEIRYVYPGNTPQLNNHTFCPGCGNLLIERDLYRSTLLGISKDGFCFQCKLKIHGVFNGTTS